MSKWYKVTGLEYSKDLLLEERDGKVYERFVTNDVGISWKVTGEKMFPLGNTTERFDRFKKFLPSYVKLEEITEEEVFAIML